MRDHQVDPDEAIAQLSEEAMVCRDLMHSWQPWQASEVRDKRKVVGYERVLKCRSCSTERVETLNSWGGLVNRRYDYPEGYLVPGVGRFDGDYKDRARLGNLLRAVKATKQRKDEA